MLQRKVIDVLTEEVSAEELKNFIDLTLEMSVGDEFVKHVPTLRVNFKKWFIYLVIMGYQSV